MSCRAVGVAEPGQGGGHLELDRCDGLGTDGAEDGDGRRIAEQAEDQGGVGADGGFGRAEGLGHFVEVDFVAELPEGIKGCDADGAIGIVSGEVFEDRAVGGGAAFAGGHGGGEADDPGGIVESLFDDGLGAGIVERLEGFDGVGADGGLGGTGLQLQDGNGALQGVGALKGAGICDRDAGGQSEHEEAGCGRRQAFVYIHS